MAKRPLHVLTLISGVVWVAAAGVVGRSFFLGDSIWITMARESFVAATVDAKLVLAHYRVPAFPNDLFKHFEHPVALTREELEDIWPSVTGIRSLGVGWAGLRGDYPKVVIPIWLLPLLTAILPLRWLLLWRARRPFYGRGFAVVADREMNHGGAEARRRATPD